MWYFTFVVSKSQVLLNLHHRFDQNAYAINFYLLIVELLLTMIYLISPNIFLSEIEYIFLNV